MIHQREPRDICPGPFPSTLSDGCPDHLILVLCYWEGYSGNADHGICHCERNAALIRETDWLANRKRQCSE